MKSSIFNVKKALTTTIFGFLSSGGPRSDNTSGSLSRLNTISGNNIHHTQSQPINIPSPTTYFPEETGGIAISGGKKTPLESGWSEYSSEGCESINSDEFVEKEEIEQAGSESSYPSNLYMDDIGACDDNSRFTYDDDIWHGEEYTSQEARVFNVSFRPLGQVLDVIKEEEEPPSIDSQEEGSEEGAGKFITGCSNLKPKEFLHASVIAVPRRIKKEESSVIDRNRQFHSIKKTRLSAR
jgi:hypothetical protein